MPKRGGDLANGASDLKTDSGEECFNNVRSSLDPFALLRAGSPLAAGFDWLVGCRVFDCLINLLLASWVSLSGRFENGVDFGASFTINKPYQYEETQTPYPVDRRLRAFLVVSHEQGACR